MPSRSLSKPGLAAAPPGLGHWSHTPPAPGSGNGRPTIDLLRAMPLLRPLQEPLLARLCRHSHLEIVPRARTIVRQGDVRRVLIMVVSGTVHVVRTLPKARPLLMEVLEGPGAPHGELALLDGQPHAATLRSQTACKLLVIDGNAFLQVLAHDAHLRQALMLSLVTRLRQAHRRVLSLAVDGVRGRVVAALRAAGEDRGDGWTVLRRFSCSELAARVGASREGVSRAVRALTLSGQLREHDGGGFCMAPPDQG